MPRLPRIDAPGIAQHVIQRGNNRQIIFKANEDFAAYASWLREYSIEYGVDVHAWVFMSNHVHLLLTSHQPSGVSKLMQSIGRCYVQSFNRKYLRTGTLWEGRFRSCIVESSSYLLECYRYIELNPVRAGMVEHPMDYHWSSYATNALGVSSTLCTPHPLYLGLGNSEQQRLAAYSDLCANKIPATVVDDIRQSTQKGLALGSREFKEQMAERLGRPVTHRNSGRPKKTRL